MTRLLYMTDLHGVSEAYDTALNIAVETGIYAIVNGGDMLPKRGPQSPFLSKFLDVWVEKCADLGIRFYGQFGNDDYKCALPSWRAIVEDFPGVCFDLNDQWHPLPGGHSIRGFSYVPDYPFGLKDWVRRDYRGAPPVPQSSLPCLTESGSLRPIPHHEQFLDGRPTLEEMMDSLSPPPLDMNKGILVAHAPPRGCGLATLWDGTDVGSLAVRRWIERHQPLLTLSGHIHESPDAESMLYGKPAHSAMLGRTTCHQPGQRLPSEFTFSIVTLDETLRIEHRQSQVRLPRNARP